jgi:hypothetical protein
MVRSTLHNTLAATWLRLAIGPSMDVHSVWLMRYLKQVQYVEPLEVHFFLVSLSPWLGMLMRVYSIIACDLLWIVTGYDNSPFYGPCRKIRFAPHREHSISPIINWKRRQPSTKPSRWHFCLLFRGPLAILQKAPISFVLPVRPSDLMEHLGSYWTVFNKIWSLSVFRKYVGKIQVLLKSDKNKGYCAWRPVCILTCICLSARFFVWPSRTSCPIDVTPGILTASRVT